ncbi:hypothetical protein BOTCAL_0232g00170 [Botryotinia calthae]|uniref:Uncharacterized protein n=1 Tax=Botryotinia calthae TaxID=38488 RepID=A0A4Y8CZT9_9HELO|nr:hypothetical protein BOTCAL_0232g00170 [Botryotinia calthae]
MSSNTIYLITGANRGLGKTMEATFVARPATTIIAAVRDPLATNSIALHKLSVGNSGKLILVKIDNSSQNDPTDAVEELQCKYQIHHIDVVIANAAIGKTYDKPFALTCMGITIDDMYEHFTVNAVGILLLFRATLQLLEKSANSQGPKFVVMTSFTGSIGAMEGCPVPNAEYGPSKAGVNYLSRKIHFEHEFLTAFALNPGWVQTDTGNAGAQMFGLKEASLSIDESVAGIVKVIDAATREHTSGKFMEHTGNELDW